MSTLNLHRLFNPKSVAVVGASEKDGSVQAMQAQADWLMKLSNFLFLIALCG